MNKKEFLTKITETYGGFNDEKTANRIEAYNTLLDSTIKLDDYSGVWLYLLQNNQTGFNFPPATGLIYKAIVEQMESNRYREV